MAPAHSQPGLRPDHYPVMQDQELTLKLFAGIKMHYWEGMCRVEGTHHGKPVRGNSYVEITNRSEVKKIREGAEEVATQDQKTGRSE
ncbi:hypothetical protein MUN84_12365 [Hymenobacter sp. 5516J-16]|nr:lipocalin family protein [Hymenobacter sp. 5516J-16]UOQ75491.1 hypothetical protein MUN84_12365 [Hymenobacter sp. 5516J-16]